MAKENDQADRSNMLRALEVGASARLQSSPNPWVGCVILPQSGGSGFEGATSPPGGPHAEIVALGRAGEAASGSTV
jgi:diaminohydroxyphosphoribosylaminopyrimidine deaminase/5-amino-6-(5-phosphoribosylamino)uracil reductase